MSSIFGMLGKVSKPVPIFEGTLKMPMILGQVAPRHVELYEGQLVYYLAKDGIKVGKVDLTECTVIKDAPSRAFSFSLTEAGSVWSFIAKNDKDKQEWKNQLHAVVEGKKRNRLNPNPTTADSGGSIRLAVAQSVQTRPVVHIKIIQARNLAALDPGGTSDPYVQVRVGSALATTTTRKKTLAPVWGMIFDFDRTRSLRYAKIEVFDKDFGTSDDSLGSLYIPLLSRNPDQTSQPEWYRLERKNTKSHIKEGEIEIDINLEYEIEDSRNYNLIQFFNQVRLLPEFVLNILGQNNKIFPCSFPPPMLEMLEDMSSCVTMYFHKPGTTRKVYSKGFLFLSNYRLLFFSLARLNEIANMAANRKMLMDLIRDENFDLSTQVPLGSIISIEYKTKPDRGGVVSEHFKIQTSDNRLLKFVYNNDMVYKLPSSDSIGGCDDASIDNEPNDIEIAFSALISESCDVIDAYHSDEGTPFNRINNRLHQTSINRNVLNHNMAKIHGKVFDSVRNCIESKKRAEALFSGDVKTGGKSGGGGGGSANASNSDVFSILEKQSSLPMGWSAETANREASETGLTSVAAFRRDIDLLSLTALETLQENFLVGWKNYDPIVEFARMGVDDWLWKVSKLNEKYELCPTYPSLLAIPNHPEITDDIIKESAVFRSKGRIPTLSWRNMTGENKCVICRCSQPMVGLTSQRSPADELLFEWMNYCSGDTARKRADSTDPKFDPRNENRVMIIFDARPFLNAQANQVGGRGFENEKNYKNSTIMFMDISNIHAVRASLEAVEAGIHDETNWLKALDSSLWLSNIRKILLATVKIVQCVRMENISALVHCSDGWDRTAQLTSLSMLLADPYYRTLKGFAVLIEKEWVSFGHKFGERLGWSEKGWDDGERSPVFLQFLDCVHQCLKQEQRAFEFNESLLIFIAEHLQSGWFGNFLFECHKELEEHKLETISIWTYVLNNSELFLNKDYFATSAPVIPIITQHRMVFWAGWFSRWQDTIWTAEYRNDILDKTQLGFHVDQDTFDDLAPTDINPGAGSWVDDKNVNGCSKCSKAFSLFRRKHHCRKCGLVFCEHCTNQQRFIDGKMSRTCADCAVKIDQAKFLGQSEQPAVKAASQLQQRPTENYTDFWKDESGK